MVGKDKVGIGAVHHTKTKKTDMETATRRLADTRYHEWLLNIAPGCGAQRMEHEARERSRLVEGKYSG